MKTLTSLTLTIFCALAFSTVGSAQAAGTGKIAAVNTEAFKNAGGIRKFVAAVKTLEAEFAPAVKELETMRTRIGSLEKEIKVLQASGASGNQQAVQQKIDEYEKLVRDYKFKEEEVRSRYSKRYEAVTGPVSKAVGAALEEYAKQNGYSVIFDLAQDKNGLIIMITDTKVDITEAFITFFNAKP